MNRTPPQITSLSVTKLIRERVLRRSSLVVALSLSCSVLLPIARAQVEDTAYGQSALSNVTTGDFNTAIGAFALLDDTSGFANTAIGADTLKANTTGANNTAIGWLALRLNNGNDNTAAGFTALYSNRIGGANTANGSAALHDNTGGSYNTADGADALSHNTTGNYNTASGSAALEFNNGGSNNTAMGFGALDANTSGNNNMAAGGSALSHNTIGSSNVALGVNAGANLTTGSNNIFIGAGVLGAAGDANKIRIGKVGTQTRTFIAGIRGITTANANAIPVVIDSAGQLGTISSSRRFKNEIKPMDEMSEAILELKPVSFHYKNDRTGTPQFGLIAEEVAKVNPDLVVRDEAGDVYTVRYEAVNAMLLNEFLKEHRHIQRLEAIVAQQQKAIDTLTVTVQKVRDEAEVAKAAPNLVADSR